MIATDAYHLAKVVHDHAQAVGLRWDPPGIQSEIQALLDAGTEPPRILAAAWSAAGDPRARTPRAMSWSQHPAAEAPRAAIDNGPMCAECSRSERACRLADRRVPQDQRHQFQPITDRRTDR